MPEISCPSCRAKLNVPAEALGKRVRCSGCGTVIATNAPTSAVTEKPASKPAPAPKNPLDFGDKPQKEALDFSENAPSGGAGLDFSQPDTSLETQKRHAFQKSVRWGVFSLRLASAALIAHALVGLALLVLTGGIGCAIGFAVYSSFVSGMVLSGAHSMRYGRRYLYVLLVVGIVLLAGFGSVLFAAWAFWMAYDRGWDLVFVTLGGSGAMCGVIYLLLALWPTLLILRRDIRERFKGGTEDRKKA